MPESTSNLPQKPVAATPNLEREQDIIRFLDSHRGIFAILAKGTKISVSFTDDPSVTGYMQPTTKSIVLGTKWMADTGLDNTQALFVPVHEYGHADNMMEEGDKYLESFHTLKQYSQPVKTWFREQIAAKGKILTTNQQVNLDNYLDKKYFEFWNIVDDIAINRWSLNQVPKLARDNTLEKLYKDHLFPANSGDKKSADYTDLPLHTQYQYFLLRNEMVSEAASPTIITLDVLDVINEFNHRTILSPNALSIKDIVNLSTNNMRITNQSGAKQNRIPQYSTRLDLTLAFVAPTFDTLLKKDFEKLLEDFEKNEDAQPKQNPQQDQGEKSKGSDGSPSPKTLDEFLESLENQTSSKNTTFFDNEDPESKSIPSAFRPDSPEDLEKLKEKIKAILEKIKKDNTVETQEEKQASAFLQNNPNITSDQYSSYQQLKGSVAPFTRELSEFWGVLLGKQREQRKISTRLSESGAKMNSIAIIRNYGKITQGQPAQIFDKTIRGYDEGNEKPREIRFRIVLDRSSSMDEGNKTFVLKQMYTVLMESFQNYRVRAKLSGAIKEGSYIDFRTECWGYGSKVSCMKPLSDPMAENEQAAILSSFCQILPNLGETYDEIMVRTLDAKIDSDKKSSKTLSKKALDIVFYFTDGSPSNVAGLNEALEGIDSNSVLWRAFQIEDNSPQFDSVWNSHPNTRGMPVSLETMIPVVVEQLKEIINKL
jgi:hypothetical protein